MTDKKELNILTIVENIYTKELVTIWSYIEKFKKYKINMFVGMYNNSINPFGSSQLIYKIDYMKKHGYDVNLYIITLYEVSCALNRNINITDNLKKCFEEYLHKIHKKNWVLFLNHFTLFSDYPPEKLYYHIDNDLKCFFADGYCHYGRVDINEPDGWSNLSQDYPLITKDKETNGGCIVASFTLDATTSEFFNSWYDYIERKFREGGEIA
ncbi:MAG: hypothetical protein N3A54_00425 [Patescibacteria group bacterium]|nr:hypothetical protein [Patescibacteria group bacterium]